MVAFIPAILKLFFICIVYVSLSFIVATHYHKTSDDTELEDWYRREKGGDE